MDEKDRVREMVDDFQTDLQTLHGDWVEDDTNAEARWRQADACRDVAEVMMERHRYALAAALVVEGRIILEGD